MDGCTQHGPSEDRFMLLPEDVLRRVCRGLPLNDLVSLHAACRRLRALVRGVAVRPCVRIQAHRADLNLSIFGPGLLDDVELMVLKPRSGLSSPTIADELLAFPHVPRFRRVQVRLEANDDSDKSSVLDAPRLLHALRDATSLSLPATYLSHGPTVLSHLTALHTLAVRCHTQSQAELDWVVDAAVALPQLHTLAIDGFGRVSTRMPVFGSQSVGRLASLQALVVRNANVEFQGSLAGMRRLTRLEVEQPWGYLDFGTLEGMSSLIHAHLHMWSVGLYRDVQTEGGEEKEILDLPSLQTLSIHAVCKVLVPFSIPSLKSLHISFGKDISFHGRLSDCSMLSSLVLGRKSVLREAPDNFCLADAAVLERLEHMELSSRLCEGPLALAPLGRVRSITVTDWRDNAAADVERALHGLTQTEEFKLEYVGPEPLPAFGNFATLPRLKRLSLTARAFGEAGHVPTIFPCGLFSRLEQLTLGHPWVHERLSVPQPLTGVRELELRVRRLTDVHPSWKRMAAAVRHLTLVLSAQECIDQAAHDDTDHAALGELPLVVPSRGDAGAHQGAEVAGCSGGGLPTKELEGMVPTSIGSSSCGGSSGSSAGGGGGGGSGSGGSSSTDSWPSVQRLTLESGSLRFIEWEWLAQFPGLLLLYLDTPKLKEVSDLPPRGSPPLPPRLVEVHLSNSHHALRLEARQACRPVQSRVRVCELKSSVRCCGNVCSSEIHAFH